MEKNKKAKTKRTKRKSKVTKSKKTNAHAVAFNVSVPPAFLKKIDVAARKADLPRSAFVRKQLEARI